MSYNPQHNKREMPDDFMEFAPGKSLKEITQHYHCAVRTAVRWRREANIVPTNINMPPPRNRPVPDDFAEMCRRLTTYALANHYRTGGDTVKRWLAKTGLKPVYNDPSALGRMGTPLYGNMSYTKTRSMFDEAADVLRKERWVVYRCDAKGNYEQAGKWYRVGRIICTPDEMLQRADKYR